MAAVTAQDAWGWFSGVPLQILVTVVAAVVARAVLHRAIRGFVDTTVSRREGRIVDRGRSAVGMVATKAGINTERHRQRTLTLGSLLRSVVTFVISLITLLTVMALLGIPLAPLLASAGVGGVALGFGAQSLVKDFLSGVFMILEDQYGVGDLVDTGEAIGTVEEVTLRITRLRDAQGVVWYVRNGEIIRIANRSQGWSTATVDLPFSYREDVDRVGRIIREAISGLEDEPEWSAAVLDPPQLLGVESITGGTVTMRVLARCAPDEHWGVQREIRRRVKDAFDREGVKGPPFPPVATV
ncbi:mechanosensitive ion channel family protein [Janibacter melonis]|uniref:mechanosensitive ion channel family protein n=1 Tax=Janibacter melonis TaxID=262209 RepID=UPI0035583388